MENLGARITLLVGRRWSSGEAIERGAEILDLQMGIGVRGQLDVLVAEDPLDAVQVHARPNQQGRRGVAQVVEPHLPRQSPSGNLVFAVLASANRDETQFKDPDKLDLTREPNMHLAFGLGSHYCLGAPLARLEGQIALRTLIERLPKLRLTKPAESLRWRKSVLLRGLVKLPVAV